MDTNVHTSLYGAGFGKHRKENAVFYWARGAEIALEAAQMHLKHGVTHLRDSYGQLPQLIEVRDAIAEGREIGPRMQVAGNIVGWGGAFSVTFSLIADSDLSLWEEQFSDHLAQGAGEDLMDMYPEELRVAINDYLDKGVDFVKYGGSSHWSYPTMIGFSPEAQRVIVEETHRRGLVAETHATNPESLRLAVEAGIDLIQHPEVLAGRPYSVELLTQIRERGVICSMLVNTITGAAWEQHLADVAAAEQRLANEGKAAEWGACAGPSSGRRRRSNCAASATPWAMATPCAARTRRASSTRAASSRSARTTSPPPTSSSCASRNPSGRSPASAR